MIIAQLIADALPKAKKKISVRGRVPRMVIFTTAGRSCSRPPRSPSSSSRSVYFAVIQPANDQADEAIDRGFQQSEQALDQAQQQLDESQSGGGGAGGTANEQIDQAQLLAQCLAEAGADVDAVQDCQAEFGP